MKRINVIGTSGSGKSHFSQRLAKKLQIQYIELDAIHWQPNWQGLEDHIFFNQLETMLMADTWVLDGNYSKTNAIKWQYVDTIIWLNFSFWHTFRQVVNRSIKRAWSKGEIWAGTGNRESFRKSFFHSDSVILWMLSNYTKTRKKYTKLFDDPQLKGVNRIRLSSQQQMDNFLATVRQK